MGATDCERIGEGLLAQPVNALSSLAYVAAGGLLLWRALAARSAERLVLAGYAVTVIAVGIGSVAFHGPMPSWGRFVHDFSIVSVLAFVIGYDLALARGTSRCSAVTATAALLGAGAIVLAVSPDASNPLDVVLVAGAVIAEIAVARSPGRRALAGDLVAQPAVWYFGAAVLAVGGTLNVLGRTDAPLCDPDSLGQLHAVWHVVTAAVLWLYGTAVLEPRERARNNIPV